MSWTFSSYNGVNFGISCGLCFIIMIAVFVTFCTSPKGKRFVHDRIVGIEPTNVDDEDEDEHEVTKTQSVVSKPPKSDKNTIDCVSVLLCILGTAALSIAAVLMFQGCFLVNARLVPNDDCPDYPVDCFVFNGTSPTPISQSPSFQCDPSNRTQFPSNLTDAIAYCFGWIIAKQTTKRFLDQLGVCTGLIGLFTTLLAIIVYLGRSIKSLVLSMIFIMSSVTSIIIVAVYKWSFAPLTYFVLCLWLGLGIFGTILQCILPTSEKVKSEDKPSDTDSNQANTPAISPVPDMTSISPTTESARRPKSIIRSSKVAPE